MYNDISGEMSNVKFVGLNTVMEVNLELEVVIDKLILKKRESRRKLS